jgi:hypothetical protein
MSLKDYSELDEYTYKVCEISSCEDEAEEIYTTDNRIIHVCDSHYKQLKQNHYLW